MSETYDVVSLVLFSYIIYDIVTVFVYHLCEPAANCQLLVRYNWLYLARCDLSDGALDQLLKEMQSAGIRTFSGNTGWGRSG